MTEIEKLRHRLLLKGTTGFHVSWGPDAKDLTPEARAAYINQMLDAVEAGEYDDMPMPSLQRSDRKVNIKELVKKLLCERGETVDAQR